ncbi:hypothetical protein DICSQDRAFT_181271 [Dichomitus squalens LYAD-421 SS1]|uniref:Uncharacterized protein n=1 Tax=Dichomitus squalens (strain LYAD-421) TaxID=732165 RepID=R7SXW0_DICSQ|nr:uncharacterized protein DICSQDRAFT_181271 [Dichomitus squalens LYAD-421 SS1]EJF60565.1 hypothetical protein DICSQDRAFT_181271 [Dichomitus squalens LYAD-421 SS1]
MYRDRGDAVSESRSQREGLNTLEQSHMAPGFSAAHVSTLWTVQTLCEYHGTTGMSDGVPRGVSRLPVWRARILHLPCLPCCPPLSDEFSQWSVRGPVPKRDGSPTHLLVALPNRRSRSLDTPNQAVHLPARTLTRLPAARRGHARPFQLGTPSTREWYENDAFEHSVLQTRPARATLPAILGYFELAAIAIIASDDSDNGVAVTLIGRTLAASLRRLGEATYNRRRIDDDDEGGRRRKGRSVRLVMGQI